jgi:hypothetical protein
MSFSNMYEKRIHYKTVHNVRIYFHMWLQVLNVDSFSKLTHLPPIGSFSIKLYINEIYVSNLGSYLKQYEKQGVSKDKIITVGIPQ